MIFEFENPQEVGKVPIMRGIIGKRQLFSINHQCSPFVLSLRPALLRLIEEFDTTRLPH